MERRGDNVEITSKTKRINSLNTVTGTKESMGCASSAMVGMKSTPELFSRQDSQELAKKRR